MNLRVAMAGLLTKSEAAAILGCSEKRVDELRRDGTLAWQKFGASVMLPAPDVIALSLAAREER